MKKVVLALALVLTVSLSSTVVAGSSFGKFSKGATTQGFKVSN